MVNQVGTQFQGLDEPGRGQGGVHQQRHACVVGYLRDGRNVKHVQPRVAHGLAKEQARAGPHGGAPGIQVAGRYEGGFDAEAAQREVQQVVRATVQRRAGHDVPARAHQRGDGQVQRSLATGRGDGAHAAFQRRDALL
ncbi:hypothetical protein SDC9_207561 [bioreactor metagenome]|uniref:Uncharacterized protein n=1 Tax=bioreactor metagenome TaxID=1076179 RepID=A0A645JAT1_9ZZZZ